MQASKNDFLDHFKWLRRAVQAAGPGAEFIVTGETLHVLLRHGATHAALQPRFLTGPSGEERYTPILVEETTQFAGWLPYTAKRWPLSGDKLAFKRFAAAAGLRVPEHSTSSADALPDVVVKRSAGSFGRDLFGPFRSSRERPLDLTQAEFYERFVEGDLLKIWFWEDQPICAELEEMSSVVGDGASPIRELLVRRVRRRREFSEEQLPGVLEECAAVLRYYGVDLDTVLPAGARQTVDFRYGTLVRDRRARQNVDLRSGDQVPWLPAARRAGEVLFNAIPAEIRGHTLFTVDAILDRGGEVWLLEMNSNPVVHPFAYDLIVRSVLARPEGPVGAARAEPVRPVQ